jgi:hypothetical protein
MRNVARSNSRCKYSVSIRLLPCSRHVEFRYSQKDRQTHRGTLEWETWLLVQLKWPNAARNSRQNTGRWTDAMNSVIKQGVLGTVYSSCISSCPAEWPRSLRRGSAAVLLLELWVWIPPGAWKSVCCECCAFSGRDLCDGLITRPGESYRVWCVWVRSWSLDNEVALAHYGLLRHKNISRKCSLHQRSQ